MIYEWHSTECGIIPKQIEGNVGWGKSPLWFQESVLMFWTMLPSPFNDFFKIFSSCTLGFVFFTCHWVQNCALIQRNSSYLCPVSTDTSLVWRARWDPLCVSLMDCSTIDLRELKTVYYFLHVNCLTKLYAVPHQHVVPRPKIQEL